MANKDIKTIHASSTKTLDVLYNDSAFTIEGLKLENIPDVVKWVEGYTKFKNKRVYIVSGETMNTYCGNTGDNAYPNDLNIISIKLSDMRNPMNLVIPRFRVGGRWFDDVVNNNRRRETEKANA